MNTKLKDQLIDKLSVRSTDMHKRRITNAADSVNPSDYTTQKEVMGLVDKLTTDISSLQTKVGLKGDNPQFFNKALPLELVSEHINVPHASGVQFVIADGNPNRNCISFMSYANNSQYMMMGARYDPGDSFWIASDTTATLIEHASTGLLIHISTGNTLGQPCNPFKRVAQFLDNNLFALDSGASVKKIDTIVHDPGVDTSLVTEKAVRDLFNTIDGYTGYVQVKYYTLSGNLVVGYTLVTTSTLQMNFEKGICKTVVSV